MHVCGLTSLLGNRSIQKCKQRVIVPDWKQKHSRYSRSSLLEAGGRMFNLMRTGFKGLMVYQRKLKIRESVLLYETRFVRSAFQSRHSRQFGRALEPAINRLSQGIEEMRMELKLPLRRFGIWLAVCVGVNIFPAAGGGSAGVKTEELQPVQFTRQFVGMHTLSPTRHWPDLPFGSIRPAGTSWGALEPAKGQYDW